MPTILMPDVLAVLGRVLRADPAVAALAGDRVSTRLPGGWPAVRLDAAGGIQAFKDRLDAPRVDVHAFATDEAVAVTLARTARAVIDAAGNYTEPGVVVITATETTPHRNQTIPDRSPTVYDYTFTATVTVRPDP